MRDPYGVGGEMSKLDDIVNTVCTLVMMGCMCILFLLVVCLFVATVHIMVVTIF